MNDMDPTVIATKTSSDNSEKYYYIGLNRNNLTIIWTTDNNNDYYLNDHLGDVSDVKKFHKILSKHSKDPLYQDTTSPPIMELPEINALATEYIKNNNFLCGSFEVLSGVLQDFPGTVKLLEEFKDLCDTHLYLQEAEADILADEMERER